MPEPIDLDAIKARCDAAAPEAAETVGPALLLVEAFGAVARRLLTGDVPDYWQTLDDALPAWVDRLPEDEAAAVNAILGTSIGSRPLGILSDHPVSVAYRGVCGGPEPSSPEAGI